MHNLVTEPPDMTLLLCPSSRLSAQVFCLPFWIKEAYEGNPNYLRNKTTV